MYDTIRLFINRGNGVCMTLDCCRPHRSSLCSHRLGPSSSSMICTDSSITRSDTPSSPCQPSHDNTKNHYNKIRTKALGGETDAKKKKAMQTTDACSQARKTEPAVERSRSATIMMGSNGLSVRQTAAHRTRPVLHDLAPPRFLCAMSIYFRLSRRYRPRCSRQTRKTCQAFTSRKP